MKEIPLTRGYVSLVDDEDFAALSAYKWHAKVHRNGKIYAIRNTPKPRGEQPATLKMHRVILGVVDGVLVDHENGDGLDNRRENLRAATSSQNQANRRVTSNQHGYKGVAFIGYTQNKGKRWTRRKPWKASIAVEERLISLGYYLSPEEAADAYDRGAVKYFGQFAATNAALGLR